ncbi:MAG: c-type cytochrome [Rhizobiales bacterium]|nr:c-type cytochrome [Hyphomicrobiales bacterium]
MRARLIGLVTVSLLAANAGAAWAQESGDARAGRAFARGTCATCHAVQKGETHSAVAEAPPFEAIAAVPGMSAIALRSVLTSPHHRMPNIVLTPADMADVVAYILSLKP